MNPSHLRSTWRVGALAGLLPLDLAAHPWRLAVAAGVLVVAELAVRGAPGWRGQLVAPEPRPRRPAPARRRPVPCHDWARERRLHPHHRRGLLGQRHR